MKKLLVAAIVAMSIISCNEAEKKETTVVTSTETTTTATETVASEGEFMMKDNKVMVWKAGEWVIVTEPVTLSNGTVVMPNGEVKNTEGVTFTLTNGERLSTTGVVVKTNGDNVLDDIGDGIKKGANEAGDAIEKGAKKTGEAVKKGVNKAGEGLEKAGEELKKVGQ